MEIYAILRALVICSAFRGTLTCQGRDVESISRVLADVPDLQGLANLLDVRHLDIKANCAQQGVAEAQCFRRELVRSYCDNQPSGDPYKVAGDMAEALEQMKHKHQAEQLRKLKFDGSEKNEPARKAETTLQGSGNFTSDSITDFIQQNWTSALFTVMALFIPTCAVVYFCIRALVTSAKSAGPSANTSLKNQAAFAGPSDQMGRIVPDSPPPDTKSSKWIESATIDPKGKEIVEASMQKRGLTIIYTCDYKNTKMAHLPGTKKDAEEMVKTSEKLKFYTHRLSNPTKAQIRKEVQCISSALPLLEKATSFKAIIFVFSGHGTDPDMIYSQDCEELDLQADIVQPLIGHQQITHIPKLFFVDACRGKENLTSIAEGTIAKGTIANETNYLIGYATIPRHKAYLTPDNSQSEWLPTLAEYLRIHRSEPVEIILPRAITRVFKRTREQGQGRTQQGSIHYRLSIGPLYLHPDYESQWWCTTL